MLEAKNDYQTSVIEEFKLQTPNLQTNRSNSVAITPVQASIMMKQLED